MNGFLALMTAVAALVVAVIEAAAGATPDEVVGWAALSVASVALMRTYPRPRR